MKQTWSQYIAIEKLGKRNVLELTGTMCLKADRRMFQTLE